jgi:hypothetical protein
MKPQRSAPRDTAPLQRDEAEIRRLDCLWEFVNALPVEAQESALRDDEVVRRLAQKLNVPVFVLFMYEQMTCSNPDITAPEIIEGLEYLGRIRGLEIDSAALRQALDPVSYDAEEGQSGAEAGGDR